MIQCSFPNCHYVADVITNVHCKQSHGMTKKDVIATHGDPKPISMCGHKLRENNKINVIRREESYYQLPESKVIREKMKGLHKSYD